MIRTRNSPLFWSLHIHIDCIKHPGDSNVCKYKTCAYSISMISCSFTYIYQSSQDHAAHLPLVNADSTCRSGLKWSWEWAFIGLRVQIIVSPDKQLHFSPAKRRICSMINCLFHRVLLPWWVQDANKVEKAAEKKSEWNSGLSRRSLEMDACPVFLQKWNLRSPSYEWSTQCRDVL